MLFAYAVIYGIPAALVIASVCLIGAELASVYTGRKGR